MQNKLINLQEMTVEKATYDSILYIFEGAFSESVSTHFGKDKTLKDELHHCFFFIPQMLKKIRQLLILVERYQAKKL